MKGTSNHSAENMARPGILHGVANLSARHCNDAQQVLGGLIIYKLCRLNHVLYYKSLIFDEYVFITQPKIMRFKVNVIH